MMRRTWFACGGLMLLALGGCARSAPEGSATSEASAGPSADGARFLSSVEPEGALSVIAAREQSQDEQEIVIVGRIGGSHNPWVEDRAAFSIVDQSLKACSDIEGDNCPSPWDYCCETDKLPGAKALVKVVNDEGELVQSDARELLALKELQTVVVKGKAQRDDAGNLTVLASSIYVRPDAGGSHAAGHSHDGEHAHEHEHEHGADGHEHKEDGQQPSDTTQDEHKHGDE